MADLDRSRSPPQKALTATAKLLPEETGSSHAVTPQHDSGHSRSTNSFLQRSLLLCLVFGGPGSGKSCLGLALQKVYPGLCHVSGGDLARLATTEEATKLSPLLNSISRQLSDRRRRKLASHRLVQVVTQILADAVRVHTELCGLIIDGLRAADISDLEEALSNPVICLLHLKCSKSTMVTRLKGRVVREGDKRLGLCDSMDEEARVQAYLDREQHDVEELQNLTLRVERQTALKFIDASHRQEDYLAEAEKALCESVSSNTSLATVLAAAKVTSVPVKIDWTHQLNLTAARLDAEMHPDGKLRQKTAA